jgi:OPT family oligopeptide transporter
MSVQEKDRWWLANVFRGDMPQLTLRSAATGFLLGGVLSATNLYVGAKTGISLGVGLTSVILAYAMFKVISRFGPKDMTILENNCMQSIATAAGYMTAPLISSLTAYMWVTNKVVPWHQIMIWNVVLSIMGVLVAFPMKRRFINDEQQPFPEGRACGVVLDTLYTSAGTKGMLQAKALVLAGLATAVIQFLAGQAYMKFIQMVLFGRDSYWFLQEKFDEFFYRAWLARGHQAPAIMGTDIRELALRGTLHLDMIGVGGLMGIKTSSSLFIGAIINFVFLAPWMIKRGDIVGTVTAAGVTKFGRAEILNQWSIWWAVTIMVVGSLVALFAKPKVLLGAFTGLFKAKAEKQPGDDEMLRIELPLWISFVGVPILCVVTGWMAHEFFGVPWLYALVSLPLTFVLSLICANAMALTSWTPTGALSKITQFTFGAIDKSNPATNLATAGITAEVASNAANLLSDIKPGYMLGGKPRHQAIGHIIGIVAGAIASTPLFFALFLTPKPVDPALESSPAAIVAPTTAQMNVKETMVNETFTFPGAVQWEGVARIIASGFKGLTPSITTSMLIAACVALFFEIAKIASRGKFPISSLGVGLGVVLPPDSTFMMWIGAMIFWLLAGHYKKKPDTTGHALWVESHEPICAGIIAGAALIGIGDKLVETFLL